MFSAINLQRKICARSSAENLIYSATGSKPISRDRLETAARTGDAFRAGHVISVSSRSRHIKGNGETNQHSCKISKNAAKASAVTAAACLQLERAYVTAQIVNTWMQGQQNKKLEALILRRILTPEKSLFTGTLYITHLFIYFTSTSPGSLRNSGGSLLNCTSEN